MYPRGGDSASPLHPHLFLAGQQHRHATPASSYHPSVRRYSPHSSLPPAPGDPAASLKAALGYAAGNADRALAMLDAIDAPPPPPALRNGHHRRTGAGGAGAGYDLARVSPPRHAGTLVPGGDDGGVGVASGPTPARSVLSDGASSVGGVGGGGGGVEKGRDVVVLGMPVVEAACRSLRIPVPYNAHVYADGQGIGTVLSVSRGLAVVDFKSDVLNFPAQALTSVTNLARLREDTRRAGGASGGVGGAPDGSARDLAGLLQTKDQQLVRLVRSLKLKAETLRRKEDDLSASRNEVTLLARQLERVKMVPWIHAPVMDERNLFVPRCDMRVPTGADITHSGVVDDAERGGGSGGGGGCLAAETSPFFSKRYTSTHAAAGSAVALGVDAMCELLVDGRDLFCHNATDCFQVDLCLKLGQDWAEPGSDRVAWSPHAPRTFTLRIFPGETVCAARLPPGVAFDGGYSASFSYGPVTDERFLRSLRADRGARVASERRVVSAVTREYAGAQEAVPSAGHLHGGTAPRDLNIDSGDHIAQLCVQAAAPFVDPFFPPEDSSVSGGADALRDGATPATWMRPSDFMQAPALFQDGADALGCDGVQVGTLGNSFFVDAVALMLDRPGAQAPGPHGFTAQHVRRLLAPPLPDEAVAEEAGCGVARVSLCCDGWWHWHVVDTYLPVVDGLRPRLAFSGSAAPREAQLWLPLLEKAYAKTFGSYANVRHGNVNHALEDLTGSPVDVLPFDDPYLYEKMDRLLADGHAVFLTAQSCDVTTPRSVELEMLTQGLAPGRVYRVTGAVKAPAGGDEGGSDVRLIRIHNGWGDPARWGGLWAASDAAAAAATDAAAASAAAAPPPA
eukprot:Rhum_TRINITY_DN10538_c0_g1::Rhum_TRINITY_DN10538_c0_g1_i1::g.38940::m.38940